MRLTAHIHHAEFASRNVGVSTTSDDITAETVAAMLNVKPSTVADWARRGIIPSYKVGRFRHYSERDISDWLIARRRS